MTCPRIPVCRRPIPAPWLAFGLAALVLTATACPPKSPPPTTPETSSAAPAPAPEPEPAAPAETTEVTEGFPVEEPVERGAVEDLDLEELNARGVLKTVYFEFDSYELSDEARAILRQNAQWLLDNPERTILIEGHCDERGTIEYNVALGQKRASAVRDYLVSLGVSPSRIRVISYGEERPVDPRHNEEAWAKNRRAEFRIVS